MAIFESIFLYKDDSQYGPSLIYPLVIIESQVIMLHKDEPVIW